MYMDVVGTSVVANKLALKLHTHSVHFAYKLVSIRRALKRQHKTAKHIQELVADNPPDPH